jgi:pimeloyl-ACP methyl ester carboxylesterase
MGDYVKVDGHKIYYEKKGEQGEAIILHHGIPTSSFLWRKVQAKLAEDFVVYAPDMLGYGKSDKPVDADYTWTAQADRLAKFMDALEIKKANIVGHDQGGGVTLIFASKYQDKVSRYISANGCTYDYCLPIIVRDCGIALKELPEEMVEKFQPFILGMWWMLLPMLVYKEQSMPTQLISRYLAPWQGKEGLRAFINVTSQPSLDELLAVDLSKIKVPALAMWAIKDRFLSVEAAYRLRNDLGGPVYIEILDNAGHFWQEDEPERGAEIIKRFILHTKP